MKTYKNLEQFYKRIQNKCDWDDFIKVDGRIYEIYEYGGGSMMNMGYDYVYFRNKRTNDMIYVKYDCPSYQYIDGVKQQTKEYRFIDMEFLPNNDLWR